MHSFGKAYFTYYHGVFSTGLYEPTLSFDQNYLTCFLFYSRDQSFSTYAKFSEKLIFLASPPPDARASVSLGLFSIFI